MPTFTEDYTSNNFSLYDNSNFIAQLQNSISAGSFSLTITSTYSLVYTAPQSYTGSVMIIVKR